MLSSRGASCQVCTGASLQAPAACRAPSTLHAVPVSAGRKLCTGCWWAGESRRSSPVCAAIKARWCIDARYGSKAEVISLLQEWVQTVGAAAGLTRDNAQLYTGSLGVPESRLELEVSLDTLAAWEAFLEAVPPQEHRAWSQRMQGMVVDGSPVWHVYRVLPISKTEQHGSAAGAARSKSGTNRHAALEPDKAASSSSGLYLPSGDALDSLASQLNTALGPASMPSVQSGSSSITPTSTPNTGSSSSAADDGDDGEIVLDWKGDPMKIKRGDKMPRFL